MENQETKTSSYRSIVKGTAIFGGVQVWNMIIGIVRGKLVAMLLGTAGMGITSLFNAASSTVQQFASLGINVSSVRDIAYWNENGDKEQCSRIVKAVRRSILISALIGALFMALFADWLSQITFGDSTYRWGFMLMSLFVFFNIMSNGENSILQGCRRLKSLAMRNMAGSVCGLVIGVPLYYWKGVDGIVPAFIISAIVLYAFSLWGTRQIKFVDIRQTWKESAGICRSLIVIGIMITFGTCLGDAARYGILGFIRMYGSINDVGLYNAANSITNQYCSLIFTAMATDYYPRLCSIINSKDETQRLINQQSELLVFILAPVVCAVILVAPIIIRVLLTAEFMSIVTIVRFFAFGLLFKAICFPFGYMILAKGDKKLYLATECIWTNIKTPAIFISMYYFFSLPGLGYATVLNSAIDVCVSLTIMKWRYGISYGVKFFRMIAIIVICLSACFASSFIDNVYVSYGLMAVFTIVVSVVSYKELDKRIKIKELLKSKLKR